MIKIFRYCGLITVGILWTSIAIGIHRAQLDLFGKSPLSHLGIVSSTARIFSIGLILAALSLVLFTRYLKTRYEVSTSFMVFLLIGQAGQIIAAVTPYGGMQPARLIHTVAALTLAFSIPFVLWRFAAAQSKPPIRRPAIALMWLEIVAFTIGIGLFSYVTKGAPFAQAMPAIALHIWIIYFSFA